MNSRFNAVSRMLIAVLGTAMPILFAIPLPARAAVTFVTSRGALGANDTVTWGQLGPAGIGIGSPVFATSLNGHLVNANTPAGAVFRRDQGVDWIGNFAPADQLLFTPNNIEALGFAFGPARDVFGAGAQIQNQALGDFTATLSVFGTSPLDLVGRMSLEGLATAAADNSALFFGVLSDSPIFGVSYTTSITGLPTGFAVNRLDLVERAVPEPPMLLTFALALLAIGVIRLSGRGRSAP